MSIVNAGSFRKEITNDANSGRLQMILTTVTVASFAVGDVITDDSDAGIHGVVTRVTGTLPNQTIQYRATAGSFSGATGAFTAVPSGAKATAVAPTACGPICMWPADAHPVTMHGKTTGSPTTGNSIEITFDSEALIDAGTAAWIVPNAVFTNMTNTAYDLTKMLSMAALFPTAFRVLRNDATTVSLLLTGVKRTYG